MQVNFDILVSGCNTECRHCYVNGGPGANMPSDAVFECIKKLDEIAAHLPFEACFTLDNEPMNHPDIVSIIRAAAATKHIKHFHHGMTTGIALMRRADRDEIIKAYIDNGFDEFGITLHGNAEHHNEIVSRNGAYQKAIEAAEYLKSRGARISVSLMFNRCFVDDAAELDGVLTALAPEFVYFAIPNFTPNSRMLGFEPYRASYGDLVAIEAYLKKWCSGADRIFQRAENGTVGAMIAQLENGASLKERFETEQDELYLSVHWDCGLFLGNSGAETVSLGDLRSLDPERTAEFIMNRRGNRDYGAFYDAERLPDTESLISALKRLDKGLVYCDPESVIHRGLAELGVPTLIL